MEIVTKRSTREALSAFRSIAEFNQVEFTLQEDDIEQVKTEYELNQQAHHDYRLSFADLFSFKSLRCMTTQPLRQWAAPRRI